MLASSGAAGPSVVQLRGGDLRPEALAPMVIATVEQLTSELESGALITLEPGGQRVRCCPSESRQGGGPTPIPRWPITQLQRLAGGQGLNVAGRFSSSEGAA